MNTRKVELLAPAGNKDAFIGAINAGADAIYLGGAKYSARAYADNFSTENIIFCIRYAHLRAKKVYLTVNTLLKEEELNELYDYILPMYNAGLDACIVQDFGVFVYLQKHFPHMELHASTQMTITGPNSAKMLKEMGATRIVPARELSLQELKNLKEQSGLEIETFIHGAMCYCYSGQCLFSSILGGRSGNRGRCAQPCRLPYSVNPASKNNGDTYPLSLKDMCTIEHLDNLIQAGIDSFKIEGRMKKPEYVAGVTAIYRKYIDRFYQAPTKPYSVEKKDMDRLSKLYIRSEIQDGYYFKHNGADMITLNNPAYSGSDDTLLSEIHDKYINISKKLPISLYSCFMAEQKASLTLVYGDISVTVEGDVVQKAQNAPLTAESIQKQLLKMGDTSFEVQNTDIYTDNTCFYSVKGMNDLRRRAVKELEDEIITANQLYALRTADSTETIANNISNISSEQAIQNTECVTASKTAWTVCVSTTEQLLALQQYAAEQNDVIKRIYLESELLLSDAHLLDSLDTNNVYLALPYTMRQKDSSKLNTLIDLAKEKHIKGFLIRNIETYSFLKGLNYTGEIYTDACIYIWNKSSLEFWTSKTTGITCPLELNKKEWYGLFQNQSYEKIVYGYLPMMITANCVLKTSDKCYKNTCKNPSYLRDRYNKIFPVIQNCDYCYNIILNSLPISLHNEILKSGELYDKRLHFTIESKEETLSILKYFLKNDPNKLTLPPYKEYTTGHEKRGVI